MKLVPDFLKRIRLLTKVGSLFCFCPVIPKCGKKGIQGATVE